MSRIDVDEEQLAQLLVLVDQVVNERDALTVANGKLFTENTRLSGEASKLKGALLEAGAKLIAATVAYEKFVGRLGVRGHSDALFNTRYSDFQKACDAVFSVLKEFNA